MHIAHFSVSTADVLKAGEIIMTRSYTTLLSSRVIRISECSLSAVKDRSKITSILAELFYALLKPGKRIRALEITLEGPLLLRSVCDGNKRSSKFSL